MLTPAWIDGELRPVEKLEVHRRGLRHPAVSVFLTAGDAVLIQKRAAGKYHTPGLWANTCCTHPGWGEDPAGCARRRLREELGVTPPPLRHCGQVEYRADVGGGLIEHEVVEVYRGEMRPDMALAPAPEEVAATRWVPRAALEAEIARDPARFTPWLRIYLARHAAMIFADPAPG